MSRKFKLRAVVEEPLLLRARELTLMSNLNAEDEMSKRNVEVFGCKGEVLAGFWQYGTVQWDEFYRYITSFLISTTEWAIFHYNCEQKEAGAHCPPSPKLVQPGNYIILSTIGERIPVELISTPPRPRVPTHSNTPARGSHYRTRSRARDGKCLITGLVSLSHSRLNAAHIFPRAHDAEWIQKGYPSKITDTADEGAMGGPTKIDSVQNIITIRSDLHNAWDNYEFGVEPNNNYRITAFFNGNDDINGRYLQLDHIEDPRLRPLDELFTDHFMQGLYKHMKGAGESAWSYEDYDSAFGEGSFNMSNTKLWNDTQGKELFEVVLAERLFDHRVSQEGVRM